MYYLNELYHYGVKGMKWGIRRYQPYRRGSRPSWGKEVGAAKKVQIRNPVSSYIKRRKLTNIEDKRISNLEKARQAAAQKREHEKAKKKAIEEGNATEILKYKNELTTQELQDAASRIQWITKLNDYSRDEMDRKFNKMNNFMTKAEKANKWATTGIGIYKNSKEIKKILEELNKSSRRSSGGDND